jgi:N utilization substance protein A
MTEINHLMESLEVTIATEQAAAQVAAIAAETAAAAPEAVLPNVEVEAAAPAEAVLEEPVAEAAPTEEVKAEASTEEIQAAELATVEGQAVPAEEETTFDELFALKPGIIEPVAEEEEEEDGSGTSKDKKKKKKKKFVELTYDPDRDVVTAKKKHKRGGIEWDWEE